MAVQLVDAGGEPRGSQPREPKPSQRGSRLIDRDVGRISKMVMLEHRVLDYLHDATLHWVRVDVLPDERRLTFAATFDRDCGDSELGGKSIEVCASDITLVRACVHGAFKGVEYITSVDRGVSSQSRTMVDSGIKVGLRRPLIEMTIASNSGSSWEICCQSVVIRAL